MIVSRVMQVISYMQDSFLGLKDKKVFVFGLLSLIMICNYALLKALKDSFIIKMIGAESIGFLKLYFLLPSTAIFLVIYTRMSNYLSQNKIFYFVGCFFILAFISLFFILNFSQEVEVNLSKHLFWEQKFPRFRWLIKVVLNWEYSIFFILAELWGAIIYTFFFFQLANSTFSSNDAQNKYPFIIMLGNLGFPCSGAVIAFLNGSIKEIFITVILINLVILLLYHLVVKYFTIETTVYQKSYKSRYLLDNLKVIFSSKKLWLLFIMIVSLGMSLNIVEVFWKGKLGQISATTSDYVKSMGRIQSLQGFISIIFGFMSLYFVKKLSWLTMSLCVPVFLFGAGTIFFAPIILGNNLHLAMFFGLMHTIIGKCIKYTLFDPAKEMIYIQLDHDMKTKGKAIVDLLGGRFGKSGVGVLETILFFFLPMANFESTTIFFTAILVFIFYIWIKSIFVLNRDLQNNV